MNDTNIDYGGVVVLVVAVIVVAVLVVVVVVVVMVVVVALSPPHPLLYNYEVDTTVPTAAQATCLYISIE